MDNRRVTDGMCSALRILQGYNSWEYAAEVGAICAAARFQDPEWALGVCKAVQLRTEQRHLKIMAVVNGGGE